MITLHVFATHAILQELASEIDLVTAKSVRTKCEHLTLLIPCLLADCGRRCGRAGAARESNAVVVLQCK